MLLSVCYAGSTYCADSDLHRGPAEIVGLPKISSYHIYCLPGEKTNVSELDPGLLLEGHQFLQGWNFLWNKNQEFNSEFRDASQS